MTHIDLHDRTYRFALTVVKTVLPLLRDPLGRVLAPQLIRSATGVAANFRVTRHAKSDAHFISKMGDVAEEAEESSLWLQLFDDLQLMPRAAARDLRRESGELTAIAVASIRTARARRRGKKKADRPSAPRPSAGIPSTSGKKASIRPAREFAYVIPD